MLDDGDGGGWFADWFNGGAFGPPMWETFHIAQLIPWIDANPRTVASDAGRGRTPAARRAAQGDARPATTRVSLLARAPALQAR